MLGLTVTEAMGDALWEADADADGEDDARRY